MDLLNTVIAQFQAILTAWEPDLILYGTRTMVAIAALGFLLVTFRSAVSGITNGMTSLMLELMFGTMKIGLVYTVMAHINEFSHAIIDSGQQIGQLITGESPFSLSPSGVYGLGLQLSESLSRAHSLTLWFTDPVSSVLTEIVIYIIVPVTWFCVALLLFMVILESLFVIVFGPMVVAFSAINLFFPMLMQWGWWLLSIALKIIAIFIVLAIGQKLARGWVAAPPNGLVVMLEGLIVFYAAWKIPAGVAHMVSIHSGAMSFGEAVMGAVAGGVAGAVTGSVKTEAADFAQAVSQAAQHITNTAE